MTTFDLTPLIRTSIGFDRLARVMDEALRCEQGSESYPPYNIEQHGEDQYRIVMAVAGFSEDDLDISIQNNTLIVSGRTSKNKRDITYLHRGIAGRAFEKHFQLADFIKIGEAAIDNGMLSIELIREIPEALKPRKISIHKRSNAQKLIDG